MEILCPSTWSRKSILTVSACEFGSLVRDKLGMLRSLTTGARFLVLATIAAYIPQHYRVRYHRDSWGISLWYLLLTAIAAAEQFAVLLNLFATVRLGDNSNVPKTVLEDPPSAGDWLNLIQLGVVWYSSLRLYALPPTNGRKAAMASHSLKLTLCPGCSSEFGTTQPRQ